MKYDYDEMDTPDILSLYFDVFGDCYKLEWNSEADDWREDVIKCIESGKPQDMSDPKYPWHKTLPEGCVA